jgi:hypothetical protein
MTIRQGDDATIILEGICPLEDAEPLWRLLRAQPGSTVDWRSCLQAHMAIVQLLMASRAVLRGPPEGAFLRDFIAPQLSLSTRSR